jgi:hypothetical protein
MRRSAESASERAKDTSPTQSRRAVQLAEAVMSIYVHSQCVPLILITFGWQATNVPTAPSCDVGKGLAADVTNNRISSSWNEGIN